MKHLMLVFLCCAGLAVNGADLVTKSGKVYKNYTLEGANRKGIVIYHARGIAAIKPEDFPDKMRPQLVKLTAEYQRKKAAAANRKVDRLRKKLCVKIMQILPGGILAIDRTPEMKRKILKSSLSSEDQFKKYFKLCSPDEQKKLNGLVKKYQTSGGYSKNTIYEFALADFLKTQPLISDAPIYYIECDTRGYIDNQKLTIKAWRIGRYQYTATNGAVRTVAKWTVERGKAIKSL